MFSDTDLVRTGDNAMGSYAPGIKQSCKAVAAFYYDALSAPVKAIPLATKYLQ